MATHTIQIPIIADTYTNYNSRDTSYGNSTIIKAGGPELSPASYNSHYHAYFKWDKTVPQLPPLKKIIETNLCLYNLSEQSSSDRLYAISEKDFTEQSTWNQINSDTIHYANVAFYYGSFPVNQYIKLKAKDYYLDYWRGLAHITAENINDDSKVLEFASRESSNPPYLEIIYEDVPPDAPTLTDPVGDYKDNTQVIRFSWTYNSSVGGTQKAFDLQWSPDQSTWTTINPTTPNNYYDMPADTLPAGNIYWRVRCYNAYDEVGPYSAVAGFYAVGAPTAPSINAVPTNSARPVITWSAFSQQIYQLQVLQGDTMVYDSGNIPGIYIRQHKVPVFLSDGTYTMRLRIKNEYDLWSAWGETAVTIATVKPAKPTLLIQKISYGLSADVALADVDYVLLYRDGICIDKQISTTGHYVLSDNSTENGIEHRYIARAVKDETFSDSDATIMAAEFKHSLIAPVSDLSRVFAFRHSLNSPPKRVFDRALGGASMLYAGRKYPVWEPAEHVSTSLSLLFFLRTWAEVEEFEAIYDLNRTILYRDAKGRKMYGALSSLQITEERSGYIISFVLNEVDYDEEIEV